MHTPPVSIAERKPLTLGCSFAGDFEGTVEADRTKLVQVLNNVLHNAIQFTHAGGVSLKLSNAPGDRMLICVDAAGIGIPRHPIRKVFTRFNMLGEESDTAEEGSGLGLALCKELLDLPGGEITVESVARNIRSLYPDHPIRVVAYTAHCQPHEPQAIRCCGFDVILVKPVSFQDMAVALARI